jgi:hypothetical protein
MIEAGWCTGFYDTDQPNPPAPGSFATHALHGSLRLGLPLATFDLYLRGGAGWMWSQPDILVRIPEFDSQLRLSWLGGAGFTWHTPRRHVWVGLEGNALGAGGLPGVMIVGTVVLGVTL